MFFVRGPETLTTDRPALPGAVASAAMVSLSLFSFAFKLYWAEACAAIVPESLLTLLLKGFLSGRHSFLPPGRVRSTFVPCFLLILHCWAMDNKELVSQ